MSAGFGSSPASGFGATPVNPFNDPTASDTRLRSVVEQIVRELVQREPSLFEARSMPESGVRPGVREGQLLRTVSNLATWTDGYTIWHGSGVPGSDVGYDGDLYLDVDGSLLYGPRVGGDWGDGVSLIGPAGADGDDGAPGSVWYNGDGVPDDSLGVDGDYYLDDLTGDVYVKESGSW